jgi:cellulose synthase/poly-beta-1,6-N-acetylglucosamine synthase-like glycosyltransferase
MPLVHASISHENSPFPIVSVVMPSYQAASSIRGALRALTLQKTSIAYEVIVVDSSSDGTDRVVSAEFPDIRLLHFADRRQVGTARNIGIDAAQGEVILFADADTIPSPTWIEEMCRTIKERGADAVCGSMANGTPWSVTGSAGFYLEFFRFVASNAQPASSRFLVGGNSGFRRDVLAGIEYANHSTGEDMLISARLARSGKRLWFVPRASMLHLNRTGFRTVFSYQYKLGQGAFLYRSAVSHGMVRPLRAFPPLVFLAPFVVMPWIVMVLLRRRRFLDFLRFLFTLPVAFAANFWWAAGFYDAARRAGRVSFEARAGAPRPGDRIA